jgi:hypothetical protein
LTRAAKSLLAARRFQPLSPIPRMGRKSLEKLMEKALSVACKGWF